MKPIFKQTIARTSNNRSASFYRSCLLVTACIAPLFVTFGFSGVALAEDTAGNLTGKTKRLTNVAPGALNERSTDAVNGSQLDATNKNVQRLDQNVNIIDGNVRLVAGVAENSVQYDKNPDGTRSNSATLVGGDPNAPVIVSNVEAGKEDTDAVNVGQLTDANEQMLRSSYGYTEAIGKYATDYAYSVGQAALDYTDARAAQTLSAANAYTDQRFDKLSGEIHDVRGEARQAAAIGLAASSLRYDDRPGKISAAIGGGVWRGESAGAFGLGYTSEDQLIRANISATTAGGEWGVGAGLSYTFN